MFAIGDDELDKKPDLGKTILCKCGKRHRVQYGEEVLADGTKNQASYWHFINVRGSLI
jgi:hypothetical protein